MQRCLYLAAKGFGAVAPNPMVGSVLVFKEKIISEGYHQQFGEAHAEVNALKNLPADLPLSECTLYVSLEPCSHFGKTPPCANLIIEKGIGHVVVGSKDPNPEVAGRGLQRLESAGIRVSYGVLESACRNLNRRFYTFHQKKRPYIILKWAQSTDGFIDITRSMETRGSFPITQPQTQMLNHQWRHQEQAILVGSKTFNTDQPLLTNRLWPGKNPLRMVVCTAGADLDAKHVQHWNETGGGVIFYQEGAEPQYSHIQSIAYHAKLPFFEALLQFCNAQQLQSLIVEGGATLLNTFIAKNMWDENRVLVGAKTVIQDGQKAPLCEGDIVSNETLPNGDMLICKRRRTL